MAEEINPYRAPESPVVEDFIAVEPRRVPTGIFVAVACCCGAAVFCLGVDFVLLEAISFRWNRGNREWQEYLDHLGWNLLIPLPIGCSAIGFLYAARCFWRRRDGRGAKAFLVAIGFFLLAISIPILGFTIPILSR